MEFTRRGCCSAAVLAKDSGPYALTPPRWMSEVTLLLWTKAHVELSVCARAWHGMTGVVVLTVLRSCRFCSVLNYISTPQPAGTWTHNHVGQSTIGLFCCRRALCSFCCSHTQNMAMFSKTQGRIRAAHEWFMITGVLLRLFTCCLFCVFVSAVHLQKNMCISFRLH